MDVSDIVVMHALLLTTLVTALTVNKVSISPMVTHAHLSPTSLDALFMLLTLQPQSAEHVPPVTFWLETDVSNQSRTVFNTSRELTFVLNAPHYSLKPLTGAVVSQETSPIVFSMIVSDFVSCATTSLQDFHFQEANVSHTLHFALLN